MKKIHIILMAIVIIITGVTAGVIVLSNAGDETTESNTIDIGPMPYTPNAVAAAAIYPGYLESLKASQPRVLKTGPDLNNLTMQEIMVMYPGVLELIEISPPENVKPRLDVNSLTMDKIMSGYPGILKLIDIPEPETTNNK
jgi:hypothetical protein